jgi:hypothetical protein
LADSGFSIALSMEFLYQRANARVARASKAAAVSKVLERHASFP